MVHALIHILVIVFLAGPCPASSVRPVSLVTWATIAALDPLMGIEDYYANAASIICREYKALVDPLAGLSYDGSKAIGCFFKGYSLAFLRSRELLLSQRFLVREVALMRLFPSWRYAASSAGIDGRIMPLASRRFLEKNVEVRTGLASSSSGAECSGGWRGLEQELIGMLVPQLYHDYMVDTARGTEFERPTWLRGAMAYHCGTNAEKRGSVATVGILPTYVGEEFVSAYVGATFFCLDDSGEPTRPGNELRCAIWSRRTGKIVSNQRVFGRYASEVLKTARQVGRQFPVRDLGGPDMAAEATTARLDRTGQPVVCFGRSDWRMAGDIIEAAVPGTRWRVAQ